MTKVRVMLGPSDEDEAVCGAIVINKLYLLSAASCFCSVLLDCSPSLAGKAKTVRIDGKPLCD